MNSDSYLGNGKKDSEDRRLSASMNDIGIRGFDVDPNELLTAVLAKLNGNNIEEDTRRLLHSALTEM